MVFPRILLLFVGSVTFCGMEKGGEEESRVQRACFTVIRDPHGWDMPCHQAATPSGEFGENLSHHAPIIRQSKSHQCIYCWLEGKGIAIHTTLGWIWIIHLL